MCLVNIEKRGKGQFLHWKLTNFHFKSFFQLLIKKQQLKHSNFVKKKFPGIFPENIIFQNIIFPSFSPSLVLFWGWTRGVASMEAGLQECWYHYSYRSLAFVYISIGEKKYIQIGKKRRNVLIFFIALFRYTILCGSR